MKNDYLLKVKSKKLFYTGDRIIEIESDLKIYRGITILSGENGSGKSTFAKILEKGRNFRTNRIEGKDGCYPKIKCIEFHDIHSLPGVSVEYYQQRYEQTMNDDIATIEEILGEKVKGELFFSLCESFKLIDSLKKKINFLSSGELRKLLIINAFLDLPDLLILDNPYIGLDKPSRETLNEVLIKLKEFGKSIMLIIQDKEEAPEFADNYIYASSLRISEYEEEKEDEPYRSFDFKKSDKEGEPQMICKLKDCEIKYDNITILTDLNWEIKEGDRWSLSGPNGSGKSTILSILNADNPKGYCSNLYLFGRKRGSGESIWDIKRRIGYVSPEMQLHFHGSGTVLELVANGLNDTVGMYIKPTEEQKQKAKEWLDHFNISGLANKNFHNLSSGERQLVLIARSFIKEPKLLILDEPMHALSKENKKLVLKTIEDFLESHKDSAFIMVTHNPENLPESINHHLKLG